MKIGLDYVKVGDYYHSSHVLERQVQRMNKILIIDDDRELCILI